MYVWGFVNSWNLSHLFYLRWSDNNIWIRSTVHEITPDNNIFSEISEIYASSSKWYQGPFDCAGVRPAQYNGDMKTSKWSRYHTRKTYPGVYLGTQIYRAQQNKSSVSGCNVTDCFRIIFTKYMPRVFEITEPKWFNNFVWTVNIYYFFMISHDLNRLSLNAMLSVLHVPSYYPL